MIKLGLFIFLFLSFCICVHAEKNFYSLKNDPIDIVIVSHAKDKITLDECIEGIRENCTNIRRVIVVSSTKLTDKGEWFDEKKFPFNKEKIAFLIGQRDEKKAQKFSKHCSIGWYLQQLLKLYSPFVIPSISSNVLIVDADTIFLNPVSFLNEANGGLFCVAHGQETQAYFQHAEKLVPGYQRIYPEFYSVTHHMLFQKSILKDLFYTVENYHQMPFWKAFCLCVDPSRCRGASEYEIYFNFAINHTDQVELRPLKWRNSGDLSQKDQFKSQGYHFVSFHSYMQRKLKINNRLNKDS